MGSAEQSPKRTKVIGCMREAQFSRRWFASVDEKA